MHLMFTFGKLYLRGPFVFFNYTGLVTVILAVGKALPPPVLYTGTIPWFPSCRTREGPGCVSLQVNDWQMITHLKECGLPDAGIKDCPILSNVPCMADEV